MSNAKSILTFGGAIAGLMVALSAAAPSAEAQPSARVPFLRPASAAPAALPGPSILRDAREGRLRPRTTAARPGGTTATLSYPYGITVAQNGTIYVTNLFGGVNLYNPAGTLTGRITSGISIPAAVSLSFNGNIYVANNGTNNVSIYNSALIPVGTIADSTLVNPTSMYIDPDDTVWVLDAPGTVHAYLNDGTTLPSAHTGGTAIGPWGPNVTVWGITSGAGGYIEDFQNRAQAVHDGPSFPMFFPSGSPYAGGETQDAAGQQYVSDFSNDLIQIWSTSSAYEVGVIHTPSTPVGVAVDSVRNRLYVVMTLVNEVYVYSTVAPYKLVGVIH